MRREFGELPQFLTGLARNLLSLPMHDPSPNWRGTVSVTPRASRRRRVGTNLAEKVTSRCNYLCVMCVTQYPLGDRFGSNCCTLLARSWPSFDTPYVFTT